MANRGATRPTINDELFPKLWCLIRPESVKAGAQAPTSVTLFDQGLADVLGASVAGLQPMQPYVLALSERADGSCKLELREGFTSNPAGTAILNTVAPMRQIVRGS